MDLKRYFDETKGVGVLSTADNEGFVNSAIYAKPHFLEDGLVTFISHDKLTRHNLLVNPSASYLFKEDVPGYQGIRLYLEKVKEEQNEDLVRSLSRRPVTSGESASERFLVSFRVKKALHLVGDTEISVQ